MSFRFGLIVIIATFAIYYPGLSGGFLYDDYYNFLYNKIITESEFDLSRIWTVMQSGEAGPLGRPISMLSFFLNYNISGTDPFSYKLINVVIHIINALLIFSVAYIFFNVRSNWLKQDTLQSSSIILAFWVALMWAIHPINITAVLYVVQRMTSMAGTFILLGILAYSYYRSNLVIKNIWLCLSLILACLILATLCKENGVLLLLYLFIVESFVFRWKFDNPLDKKIIVNLFGSIFIFSIVISIYVIKHDVINFDYSSRDFSFQERLLTQPRVIWFYILQILLPQASLFGLHHDDFTLSVSIFEPATTIFSILGLILITTFSILTIKRMPWLGFGILFFMVGHILESTIFPLNMVHEHRNYIPSFSLIVVLIISIKILAQKINLINLNVLIAIFISLFSVITLGRAHEWGSMTQYAESSMQRKQESVNTNYESAFIFMQLFYKTQNELFLKKAIFALKVADKHSEFSLKPAIALIHVSSIAKEELNKNIVNKIKLNLAKKKIKTEELIALKQLVNCKIQSICYINNAVFYEIFNSILSNPLVYGRIKDDTLYIYATFLDYVENSGDDAINIMTDIVDRNPDVLEYKVKMISLLLSNGRTDEAKTIMSNLTNEYGLKWDIIEQ